MAVISFNRQDFCRLVGKELSCEEIELKLPLLGFSWEGREGDELRVELEPNHPEMLCVEGLARMFSGFIGLRKGLPKYTINKGNYKVIVDKSVINARPFAAFAVIKGIDFDDETVRSFMQLQEKLASTYGRNRAKASIGTYDLDEISFPLIYKCVDEDFKFIPLGFDSAISVKGVLTEHSKGREFGNLLPEGKFPVYVDNKGNVLGMPPITNSEFAKIKESTRNVFIDVTGWDWFTINKMLNIVVTALAERGGRIYSVNVGERVFPDLLPQRMSVSLEYVNRLLGTNFSKMQVKDCLRRMRHDVLVDGNIFNVAIAPYRTDIMHAFDLVEEVAIAYGYENFVPEIPNLSTVGSEHRIEIVSRRIRDFLVGVGGVEVMTFMLSNKDKLFKRMNLKETGIVELENPRTIDFTHFRNSLIPSIMEVFSNNTHNNYPQKIFDLDDVLLLDNSNNTGAVTKRLLSFGICEKDAGFTMIASVLNELFFNLRVDFKLRAVINGSFIEGRCAEVVVNDKTVGFIGEVNPVVLKSWGLELPVSIFEVNIDSLSL